MNSEKKPINVFSKIISFFKSDAFKKLAKGAAYALKH